MNGRNFRDGDEDFGGRKGLRECIVRESNNLWRKRAEDMVVKGMKPKNGEVEGNDGMIEPQSLDAWQAGRFRCRRSYYEVLHITYKRRLSIAGKEGPILNSRKLDSLSSTDCMVSHGKCRRNTCFRPQ